MMSRFAKKLSPAEAVDISKQLVGSHVVQTLEYVSLAPMLACFTSVLERISLRATVFMSIPLYKVYSSNVYM